jgi:hypothetical protein
MTDWPIIAILLITYKRTELAQRTIRGVKQFLDYPKDKLVWHVADDGSSAQHVDTVLHTISVGAGYTNAERRGVGHSMNMGMDACLLRADYILWLEDDWELTAPFDLRPCVQLLTEREDVGMVRLGYISPGIRGELIGGAGRLWWRLDKGPTYTFTGHASLRHRRFCEAYGHYQEGLAAGETEIAMCTTVNNRIGPAVVVPAFTGEWGPFGHIGMESLKDLRPGS